ncbi:unnamed protein product [Prorocentrum cordatum]|uniref:SSD domain-containing protein n=1 Tax=Prorocentrum cordatum TaxID=2364126 RepID=A0ABN9TNR6_9DINO|nr:unnamed protein product [Polarella glacialis]
MREEWVEFARVELLPVLQEASRGIENKDWQLRVYFTGDELAELEIMTSLFSDLYLAAGSMLFVVAYMLFHTKSMLVSLVGFFVITLSIPTAYAISAFTTGTTSLSIASFLAVFLVVGLGSDVVFIYSDFWHDSAAKFMDLESRLAWTAVKAGKASLATTGITAVSFFANIASVLKPLREFGFFMGLCVLLVWVLLSGILVPLLVLNERCCCSLDACRAWCWLVTWCFRRRPRRHRRKPLSAAPSRTKVFFGPISEVAKPKRGAEALVAPPNEAAGSNDGAPNGKLQNLMCRMLLQHEAAHQSVARDDNFTLTLKEGAKIEMALEQGYQHYVDEGKKAREGDNFRGHPEGKKPDALFRMIIFRLAEAVQNDLENVRHAIGQGPFATKALEGLNVLLCWGPLIQDKDTMVKSTRCFEVALTEGGENQVRWTWACNHHIDLKNALTVLRLDNGLTAANIMLGHDHGPRSKAAKQLEQLAFKGGADTGEKGGAKKPKRK